MGRFEFVGYSQATAMIATTSSAVNVPGEPLRDWSCVLNLGSYFASIDQVSPPKAATHWHGFK
jgi:hypothetical protein